MPRPPQSAYWQPSCDLAALRQRAEILAGIREFFASRQVLEVETPLLGQCSVTAPYLQSLVAEGMYLQTSPEYAMKRLLAAGSGPIYQICKAFRQAESGSRHNPEFTLLEWYRPGFDHQQLMGEIEELLRFLGISGAVQALSYREVFQQRLGIDPHQSSIAELREIATKRLDLQFASERKDDWLDLLLSHEIEPELGQDCPQFIYDYPASQAALAVVAQDEYGQPVAQRFELYSHGLEIANGYHELCDAAELRQRFCRDQAQRHDQGLPHIEIDKRLLAALEHGLPACAGVALGLDRLLMALNPGCRIDDVISFPHARA